MSLETSKCLFGLYILDEDKAGCYSGTCPFCPASSWDSIDRTQSTHLLMNPAGGTARRDSATVAADKSCHRAPRASSHHPSLGATSHQANPQRIFADSCLPSPCWGLQRRKLSMDRHSRVLPSASLPAQSRLGPPTNPDTQSVCSGSRARSMRTLPRPRRCCRR